MSALAIAPAVADNEPPRETARETAKLRQILEGARAIILRDGFDGASMNDIARAAGVSKGTLYVYFDSKEALFVALIREQHSRQAERICDFEEKPGAPDEVLRGLGRRLFDKMRDPESLAHVRTVLAVAAKFPEIGRAFYEAGPQFGIDRLTAWLERQTAEGSLQVPNPHAAATQFIQLVQGDLFKRLLFCVETAIDDARVAAAVDETVDVFMRLYGPANPPAASADAEKR